MLRSSTILFFSFLLFFNTVSKASAANPAQVLTYECILSELGQPVFRAVYRQGETPLELTRDFKDRPARGDLTQLKLTIRSSADGFSATIQERLVLEDVAFPETNQQLDVALDSDFRSARFSLDRNFRELKCRRLQSE